MKQNSSGTALESRFRQINRIILTIKVLLACAMTYAFVMIGTTVYMLSFNRSAATSAVNWPMGVVIFVCVLIALRAMQLLARALHEGNVEEPIEDKRGRIKRIIDIVRFLLSTSVVCLFVGCGLLLAEVAGFHFFPPGQMNISLTAGVTYHAITEIPASSIVLMFVRIGLYLYGALVLFWLLDLFEEGSFFIPANVYYIRLLGWLILCDWMIDRLFDMAGRSLNPDLAKLSAGLLVVLVAWIMDEGRKIQEEQQLTV